MIRYFLFIAAVLLGGNCISPAQTVENKCGLIDKTRDAFFIEFEKTQDVADENGDMQPNVILRLKSNSTCEIMVLSSDIEHFKEKLPFKPSIKQIMNRPLRHKLIDGEFVPEFIYLADMRFYTDQRVPIGGFWQHDNVGLYLEGGNSLLFPVPVKHFKKKLPVLVEFEFTWETEHGGEKYIHKGDTFHLIWFPYSKLPEKLLKKIG